MEANERLGSPTPRWARVAIGVGAAIVTAAALLAALERHWLEATKGALLAGGLLLVAMPPPHRRLLRYAGVAAVGASATIAMVLLFGHRGR